MTRSKICSAMLALILAAPAAWADPVIDWNGVLLQALRTDKTAPPQASRAMACVHVAIYDAVVGLLGGYEPYRVTDSAPAGASPEAAAAAAAHHSLVGLFPAQQPTFDAALTTSLAAIPDGPAKTSGMAWGEHVADALMALRAHDHAMEIVPYTPPIGASRWVPTAPAFAPALLPNWPRVTPWTMTSGSQFRQGPPPAPGSPAYRAALREVRRLGRSESAFRTAEQTQIAQFWADGPGTATPPGHWLKIAEDLARRHGTSLLQNARLFALLSLAAADAAIVSWDNKYYYSDRRPITGIQTDEPTWTPLLATPPFPSYTSGHSTFSGASAKILELFFGTDDIAFATTSDGLPGVQRSFRRLSAAANEAGQSRIYGGIHWQYDNQAGLASGRSLAEHVFFNFLTPIDIAAQQRPARQTPASGIPGFSLFTVTPCRVVDTRTDNTPLLSNATRIFAVALSHCGIPSTAAAVSVNLTVVAPTGAGYVTAFAGDGSLPIASTINFLPGQTRANNAILPVSATGEASIALFALVGGPGSVHVVVDVAGYFATETLAILSLSPTSAPQGSPQLDLTVIATGLQPGALVRFDGHDLATTQTAADHLAATLPDTLLAAAGIFPVQAVNPDSTASAAVLFTVDAPLTLSALVPAGVALGSPDFSLILSGAGFKTGAVAHFGGTDLATTLVGSGMLTATVPAALVSQTRTVAVDVQNPGSNASTPLSFQVKPLSFTGISPTSGPVGTTVTITGTGLDLLPAILFAKQGSGTLQATLQASAAATSLQVSVPTGAATGPVQLVSGGLTLTGPVFTVTTSRTFELTGGPASGVVFPGESVNFGITASSSDGFASLVALQVAGLPGGLTYKLDPPQIAAGRTANLTVTVPAGQPVGQMPFTVTGAGSVEGQTLTKTLNLAVDVQPVSTSFIGRVVAAEAFERPLVGVTVRFLGENEQGLPNGCSVAPIRTDPGGNFAFVGLPASCTGPQLVGFDGKPDSGLLYTPVNLRYDIQSGVINRSPVLVHLTQIYDADTVLVRQNWPSDQFLTFKNLPGVKLQVYAGTTFTNPDGTTPDPFPLTGLRIPIDRVPDAMPMPAGEIMPFLMSLQPEDSSSSQPVAVDYPNTIGSDPGTVVTLLTLNPRLGAMAPYGTGTVSPDGLAIIADPNPATPGRRYGISHFDWHGPVTPNPPNSNRASLGGESGAALEGTCAATGGCFCPTHGSVEYATGAEAMGGVDVAITGIPLPVGFGRLYRSDLAAFNGPFGFGTNHSLSYVLLAGQNSSQPTINLSIPNGRQLSFVRQPDGTYRSSGVAFTRGSTLRWVAAESRYRIDTIDGSAMFFAPAFVTATRSSLSAISDRHGNQIQLVRGVGTGNIEILERIIAANGEQIELLYDTQNRIRSVTDAASRTTAYDYDAAGRLSSVTDPAGGVTRYGYDGQNHLTTVTDARGILIITKEYDSAGRVIREIYPDTGEVHYAYLTANPTDPASPVLQTQVANPLGHTTTYRFTVAGELTDVTDALGQTVSFTIDPVSGRYSEREGVAGCPVCGGSGAGDQSYEYDDQGRPTKLTDALGNSSILTYPAIGEVPSTITDALLRTTSFIQNADGDVTSITDPAGKVTLLTYDGAGRLLTITDPNHHTAIFTYGTDGRPATVRDALNRTTTLTYNAAGRIESISAPDGSKQYLTYDILDHVIAVEDGLGQLTRFNYDPAGNLLNVSDPKGNSKSYEHDSLRRPVREIAPDGKARLFSYDLNGNLKSVTDRNDHTTTLSYDALGRPLEALYQDGTSLRLSWDAAGRLLAADDASGGRVERVYDKLGRLISEISPTGSLRYEHDAVGRRTSRTGTGGLTTYTYRLQGQVESITNDAMSVSFTYDDAGHLTSALPPNNIQVSYTYDAADQLTRIDYVGPGGFNDFRGYTYDLNGRVSSVSGNSLNPPLPSPQDSHLDNRNRLIVLNGRTFQYDAEGRLSTDGLQTYLWDDRDHLSGTIGVTESTSFQYDALGRRFRKSSQGTITIFTYDGLDIARSVMNGTPSDYLRSLHLDEAWAVRREGIVQTYGRDLLNSTIAVFGDILPVTNVVYDEYGALRVAQGQSTPEIGFAGREHEQGDLIYFRARYLDSKTGRFLSEDPDLALGSNPYAYVRNSPASLIDPGGRQIEKPIFDMGILAADEILKSQLGLGKDLYERITGQTTGGLTRSEVLGVVGLIFAEVEPIATAVLVAEAVSTHLDLVSTLGEDLFGAPVGTINFKIEGLGVCGRGTKTTSIKDGIYTIQTHEEYRTFTQGTCQYPCINNQ